MLKRIEFQNNIRQSEIPKWCIPLPVMTKAVMEPTQRERWDMVKQYFPQKFIWIGTMDGYYAYNAQQMKDIL